MELTVFTKSKVLLIHHVHIHFKKPCQFSFCDYTLNSYFYISIRFYPDIREIKSRAEKLPKLPEILQTHQQHKYLVISGEKKTNPTTLDELSLKIYQLKFNLALHKRQLGYLHSSELHLWPQFFSICSLWVISLLSRFLPFIQMLMITIFYFCNA